MHFYSALVHLNTPLPNTTWVRKTDMLIPLSYNIFHQIFRMWWSYMPLGAKGCSPDVTLLDAGGQTGLLGRQKVRKGWQGLVVRYKPCHISLPKEDREYYDGFNWTPQFFCHTTELQWSNWSCISHTIKLFTNSNTRWVHKPCSVRRMDGPCFRRILTGLGGQTSLEGKKGQNILNEGFCMGSPLYRHFEVKAAYVRVRTLRIFYTIHTIPFLLHRIQRPCRF